MSGGFVDLEPEVEALLVEEGFSEPIFLGMIAEDAAEKVILIETGPFGGPKPAETPVDPHQIRIMTRDDDPKVAHDLLLSILNKLHGRTPGKFHAASALFLLSAFTDERPQRADNDDRDLAQYFATIVFRVKPLT